MADLSGTSDAVPHPTRPVLSNNLLARSIRRPKIHIADTGLLAALIGADERRISSELDLGGTFYETFVAAEIARQISWPSRSRRRPRSIAATSAA